VERERGFYYDETRSRERDDEEGVAKTVSVVIIIMIIIMKTRGWYDYVKWSHSWDNQRISFIDLAMLSRPCIIKNILKRFPLMIMMTIRG
jgi:uncharacterized protein with GYD domain